MSRTDHLFYPLVAVVEEDGTYNIECDWAGCYDDSYDVESGALISNVGDAPAQFLDDHLEKIRNLMAEIAINSKEDTAHDLITLLEPLFTAGINFEDLDEPEFDAEIIPFPVKDDE